MKLIIGLGNPGKEYAGNRHNVGFMCLSHFARTHGIPFDRRQALARIGTGRIAGMAVILARPQTYMNLSGDSVSRLVKKYSIEPSDLTVIHDDLDLPLGKIRIRQGGGAGGHKGVMSIIAALENQDFGRIRVGIGRPAVADGEADIIGYVLSDFTAEERPILNEVIARVAEALLTLLTEGLTVAMNKYN